MNRTVLLLVVLTLAGCVTARNVAPEVASTIPDGARAIVVRSDLPMDSMYAATYAAFARRGFGFTQENEARGTFTTSPLEIEQDTQVAVVALVEPDGAGSAVTLRPHWGVSGIFASSFSAATGSGIEAMQGPATWGDRGRPEVAFGEIATLAQTLPHTEIEYPTR